MILNKNIHFVYTISINNVLVYVGCTKQPIKRIHNHISCCFATTIKYRNLYSFLNRKIKDGLFPEFKFIEIYPDKNSGCIAERKLIKENKKLILNGYTKNKDNTHFILNKYDYVEEIKIIMQEVKTQVKYLYENFQY